MDAAEILAVVALIAAVVCPFVVGFVALGAMAVAPMLYRGRFAAWTEGAPREAYDRLADGATTGGFQVFPCSYMVEGHDTTHVAPDVVVEHLAQQFSSGWGRQMFTRDTTGVVGEIRFIKFLATDLGWIAAAVIEPTEDGGTVVHYRFRTTYMLPVITFFLSMRLNMHVLKRLVP